MNERREHKSWCPAYPGNVYVKTVGKVVVRARDRLDFKGVEVDSGRDRCQCGADLSERARRLITGEAS